MVSLNKVFLAGNLTRDPELRYTASGQPVAGFDLAINHVFSDRNGERREETVYVHVVVWGKQAQSTGQYLSKGSPVLVEGRLQFDTWETPQGEKRSKLKVIANRVQFLGAGRSKDMSQGSDRAPYEQQAAPAHNGPGSIQPPPSHPPMGGMSDEVFPIEDDDIPF